MRKILQDSTGTLEILDGKDRVLEFRDAAGALHFLRRLKGHPSEMAVLRTLLAGTAHDAHRMSSEEVLKQVAARLAGGQLKIIQLYPVRPGAGEEEEAEKEQAAGTARTPAEKSWIEINLRDEDGQPVPGQDYRIKLPDGSVQEGKLDSFGHAEFYDINPGSCEISFPGLDDEAWFPA